MINGHHPAAIILGILLHQPCLTLSSFNFSAVLIFRNVPKKKKRSPFKRNTPLRLNRNFGIVFRFHLAKYVYLFLHWSLAILLG